MSPHQTSPEIHVNTTAQAAEPTSPSDRSQEQDSRGVSQPTAPGTQNPILVALLHYHATGGLCVLPADPSTKKICIPTPSGNSSSWKEYQSARPGIGQVTAWAQDAQKMRLPGLAVICGAVSGGLVCIDFDVKNDPTHGSLWKTIETCLPQEIREKLVIEKTQNGGMHLFYKSANKHGNRKLAAQQQDDKKVPLETREEGGYVVCAPTLGYNVVQGSLANVSSLTPTEEAELFAALREASLNCDCAWLDDPKEVPADPRQPKSSTQGSLSPLEDFDLRGDPVPCLKAQGWRVENTLSDGTVHLCRPGKISGNSATWNYAGSRRFKCFSSNTEFDTKISYRASDVYAALQCAGDSDKAAASLKELGYGGGLIATTFPTPKPLEDPANLLIPWDFDLLPVKFQAFARNIVRELECPAEFVGVALMTAVSAVCVRGFVIRPKPDTSWYELPTLWGMIVGTPSTLKSPALDAALRPLERLREIFDKKFEEAQREYLRIPEELRATTSQPVLRRIVVNDATAPALAEMLIANPVPSALLYQDELAGLLQTVSKPDSQNLRAMLLTGWGGKNAFTLDRIGRGVRHVPKFSINILGGIQPDKLASLLLSEVDGVRSADGLLQRFNLLVFPPPIKDFCGGAACYDPMEEDQIFKIMQSLSQSETIKKLFPTAVIHKNLEICEFSFSPEAQTQFDEWLRAHMQWMRKGDLAPVLEGHFSKYKTLVAGMAGLIHVVDHPGDPFIGVSSLDKALRWSRLLQSHAEKIFSSGPLTKDTNKQAKKLMRLLLEAYTDDKIFTGREVRRKGWSGFGSKNFINDLFTVLTDHHWLIQLEDQKLKGRRTDKFRINPLVSPLSSSLLSS